MFGPWKVVGSAGGKPIRKGWRGWVDSLVWRHWFRGRMVVMNAKIDAHDPVALLRNVNPGTASVYGCQIYTGNRHMPGQVAIAVDDFGTGCNLGSGGGTYIVKDESGVAKI